MMRIILFFALLAMAFTAEAKDKVPRKPADIVEVKFSANVGHKKNSFVVSRDGLEGQMVFESTEVGHGERQISEKNYEYLLKVAQQISTEESNDKQFCQRSHFKITIKTKKSKVIKIGCVNSKTPVSEKMKNYATLMALLI